MRLPDSLPVFELLVLVTDEFPQLCVGVRECSNGKPSTSQQLQFDIIELNGTPVSVPGRTDRCAPPLQLMQLSSKVKVKSPLCLSVRLQTVEH